MRASSLARPMRKPQGKSHVVQTKAPPVGGLDSIHPLSLMPEGSAVEMDNFISSENGLALRQGWYVYAYGLPGEVRTILSFDPAPAGAMIAPASESELFAATDAGIWLVEGGGDLSADAPDIALSTSNYAGRLSSVQFSTNGGNWLVACSEIDGGFLYDGAAWLKMLPDTGTPGPGLISGIDPAQFVQVCAWKGRLGFVQRASTVAWFLPVDVVGGTAEAFDFGPVFPNGGALLALLTWTQDAGAGIDDRLVAISSAGDIAVYEGSDPTNAAAFRSVGTWYVGQPPIGRRCFTTSGGNIYLLTQLGLVPISQIVSGGLDNILTSSGDMLRQLRLLQDQLARDFATLLNTVGWELLSVPAKALFLLARPRTSNTDHTQYAFNRHTMAWGRLLDMPATTFGVRISELYGGTDDGRVLRLLDGFTDGRAFDGSGATHIRGRVTPAFSYFGAPDVLKQSLMVRPVFLARGSSAYAVQMNTDFFVRPGALTPVETDVDAARWNQAVWNDARWSPALVPESEWRSVEGLGYALSPTLFVSAQGHVVLTAIEFMLRSGGPL